MPKKRFDKKNATHFHIVHRSQRDIAEDEHGERSDFLMVPEGSMPAPAQVGSNNQQDDFTNIKDKLASMNLLADEESYDFKQHYRSMGGGDFVSAQTGTRSDQKKDFRAIDVPVEINEVDRMFESIALDENALDEDIKDALFNFDDAEFEEVLDDFCVTAAQAPAEGEDESDFDYDSHIAAMLEKARAAENGGNATRLVDDDFFAGVKPLGACDDESDVDSWENGNNETNRVPTTEEERILLSKFHETLAEYDSDDIGDLYNKEEDILNHEAAVLDVFGEEGNNAMDSILNDYLKVRDDEKLFEGSLNRDRSGYSVLVRGKIVVHNNQVNDEAGDSDGEVSDAESATEILADLDLEPPEEDLLIDGKSYFEQSTINPWDCESILSTYSNLDNNPAVIGHSGRRRQKKKKKNALGVDSTSGEPKKIILSSKTGLPMGVLTTTQKIVKTNESREPNVEQRRRGETREERKARKERVKKSKQEARLQKKVMKGVFADEFAKRSASSLTDDVGGVPVFRYS